MSSLFDRLQEKHTPRAAINSGLPEGVKPHPILTANGIRNLVTKDDACPPGLRQLVESIVGKELGEPVAFTQTLLGRTYIFCDDDGDFYEVQSNGGDWVVHKKGAAGPRTDEIPTAARSYQISWFSGVDDKVLAAQETLGEILDKFYEPPTDMRFLSRQIEWGCGIVRYHWDSNLGRLHLHRRQIDDMTECVVQIDDVPLCFHFRSMPDRTGLKLADQPDCLPF